MEKTDQGQVDRREGDRRAQARRIAERLKLPLKGIAVFTVEGKEEKRDITVRNINAFGAYFTADLRPDVSDKVILHLPIGESEDSFKATATVVRVEDDSENVVGIAVTFERFPDVG